MGEEWVILSLSSFTQLLPISHSLWALTCFLICASHNHWIRSWYVCLINNRAKARMGNDGWILMCNVCCEMMHVLSGRNEGERRELLSEIIIPQEIWNIFGLIHWIFIIFSFSFLFSLAFYIHHIYKTEKYYSPDMNSLTIFWFWFWFWWWLAIIIFKIDLVNLVNRINELFSPSVIISIMRWVIFRWNNGFFTSKFFSFLSIFMLNHHWILESTKRSNRMTIKCHS